MVGIDLPPSITCGGVREPYSLVCVTDPPTKQVGIGGHNFGHAHNARHRVFRRLARSRRRRGHRRRMHRDGGHCGAGQPIRRPRVLAVIAGVEIGFLLVDRRNGFTIWPRTGDQGASHTWAWGSFAGISGLPPASNCTRSSTPCAH